MPAFLSPPCLPADCGAVLQRLAMRREGLLRAYRKVRGQPRDFWLYATLP